MGSEYDASCFNLPRTGNYFTNRNGNKLHFRYKYSNSLLPCKSVVFYAHGYGSHVNGPVIGSAVDYLNKNGIAVFCLDFEGHGYSTGLRCYIPEFDQLPIDFLQFVQLIMKDTLPPVERPTKETELCIEYDATHSIDWFTSIRSLPFAFLGASMGGATITIAALKCNVYSNFKGIVTLAPALSISKPSWLICTLLKYTVGILNPTGHMPPSMNKTL